MVYGNIKKSAGNDYDSRGKKCQLPEKSLDRDFGPMPLSREKYIEEREFVSRIYRLTGFICEI